MIIYKEIIFNKIEQGLIYITSDLVIERHIRLWIPGMIISSREFISHVSQGPMKMLKRRLLQGETGSLGLGDQWAIRGNGLGWCRGTEVKNFVKLTWRHKAVSMVLFSKRNNGIYDPYRGVIDFKIVVEELIMLWIIGCSVFCSCSIAKKSKGKWRWGEREKVSHMLCQFAEHAFGCDRLIMGNVVINSGIFCFVEYEKMMMMVNDVLMAVLYCDKTSSVSLCRGGRGWLGMQVMQHYYWSWFSVEFFFFFFCTKGMVSLMFDFFCRSDHPIDISRWVKLLVKLTYDLPSCVCGILVVLLCVLCVFLVRRRRKRVGGGSSGRGSHMW